MNSRYDSLACFCTRPGNALNTSRKLRVTCDIIGCLDQVSEFCLRSVQRELPLPTVRVCRLSGRSRDRIRSRWRFPPAAVRRATLVRLAATWPLHQMLAAKVLSFYFSAFHFSTWFWLISKRLTFLITCNGFAEVKQ